MHRCQTQNLTPLLIPQLLPHNPIQSTPNRLPRLIDEHARIIIEPDDAPVLALHLLLRAHHNGVPDVAAPHFVGGGDGDGAPGFGAEVALLLDNYYYTVAWGRLVGFGGEVGREVCTYTGVSLHLHAFDAFDDGGA